MWKVMTGSEEHGGRSFDMVQKVFGICEAKNGTKTNELLQTKTNGHQRIWQDGEKNPNSRGRKSPSQRDTELENRWRKDKELRERSLKSC